MTEQEIKKQIEKEWKNKIDNCTGYCDDKQCIECHNDWYKDQLISSEWLKNQLTSARMEIERLKKDVSYFENQFEEGE
jgi:NAD-dependent SIR2 family protein deacetylase